MSTTEQTIVTALVDRLATIQAGQSVTIDGVTHVYANSIITSVDGRVIPFNEAELPAANVYTPESSGESNGMGHHDHTMLCVIVLHVAQTMAQKAIRTLRQDVYAAIGSDETLGGVPGLIGIGDPSRVTKCIQLADFIGSEQISIPIRYRTPRWGV